MIEPAAITLREIDLPLREPFRISSGSAHRRRILLLELHDRTGATGWSECVAADAPTYGPETVDTAWLVIERWLAPAVLGRMFEHPSTVYGTLEGAARGNRMAKGAVEMACWELAARSRGLPLAQLLGGTRSEVEVGISLGIQDSVEELVDKASAALTRGYRKIKIKIEPGADYGPLSATRERLGSRAPLMADANSAYRPEDTTTLQRLDDLDLIMIEQPLDREDLLRHARLQKVLRTPICLDESIDSPDRVEDMAALGSGKIVNIKPGRVGGFTPALAIDRYCRDAGIPVWCGGMLESGIGRAHNVALASLESFRIPGDISPSDRYWEQDIVTPEWTMSERGTIRVPLDCAGMGVTPHLERIEELTRRKRVLGGAG